jgi:predicted ATPase
LKTLRKIKVEGFKSIESAELMLGDLNVVIGANGSGKSNLIDVFRLLERVLTRNLQLYVASEPDRFLFHGRKTTPALSIDLAFDKNAYGFKLKAAKDTLIFEYERVEYGGHWNYGEPISVGHKESKLEEAVQSNRNKIPKLVFPEMHDVVAYHFHDTSDTSPAKQTVDVDDNRFFRPDAANLPAYLYWLQEKHPGQFRHIEEHIRLVAPFFDRFVLAPSKLNEKKIKLEWRQKGSDAYFDAYSLSDGTLRFIYLVVLLLQPNPPALILLDEPELGLHPFAIRILAEMLEAASKRVQVLLATQSVTLLDNFAPQDVIVAENNGLKTTFNRLNEEKLKGWLDEFSIGELWEKNVLGGRPCGARWPACDEIEFQQMLQRGTAAWSDVPNATEWVEGLRGERA